MAFIATSAGGPVPSREQLKSDPHLGLSMLQCLAAMHTLGLVHGDVALHNFVLAPDQTAVWLLDFEASRCGNTHEQQME